MASQSYPSIINWGLRCWTLNASFLTTRILPKVPKSLHVGLSIRWLTFDILCWTSLFSAFDVRQSTIDVLHFRHSVMDDRCSMFSTFENRWSTLNVLAFDNRWSTLNIFNVWKSVIDVERFGFRQSMIDVEHFSIRKLTIDVEFPSTIICRKYYELLKSQTPRLLVASPTTLVRRAQTRGWHAARGMGDMCSH